LQKHLGKTCPYCQFPIKNEVDITICPKCGIPHHYECWMENTGGTTFSCDCHVDDTVKQNNKIIIELEDLPLDNDGNRLYPSLSATPGNISFHSERSGLSNSLWYLAISGLIGGIFMWLIIPSLGFDFNYYANFSRYNQLLYEMAAFSAIMGGIIGAFLSSVDGITSKVSSKVFSGLLYGLMIGAIGGFIGAIIGQLFYNSVENMEFQSNVALYAMRGLYWSLVGLFIGIGQGIGTGGGRRISNGLLGGVIGGFISGFLFDYFFMVFASASLSGFVAITLFGFATGLSIGMVQEFRKEAWLKVREGATEGKEYILYSDKTIIGSAPQCDIVLIKDSDIAHKHAEIYCSNNTYVINDYHGSSGVWLGNRKIDRGQIKNGDNLRIGSYQLQFFEKKSV